MSEGLVSSESIITVTSVTGDTWSIEGKKFVSRKPAGFRSDFDGSLACPDRDVSVCEDCAAKYANLVDIGGQHYWVRNYGEWRELVAELCAICAEFAS